MSRIRVPLKDPTHTLLVGYDVPFGTYFAMLYTPELDDARKNDEPDKAVGYAPIERSPTEITEHGPYPCDLRLLREALTDWNLSLDEVNAAVKAAGADAPA